jgi:pilus assembly protein Flp/PilA
MWNKVRSLLKREEGQGLTEYALIIALVAVVVTVALTALQGGITGTLNGIVGSL